MIPCDNYADHADDADVDDVQMQNASWSGELPARAVVYLEMDRVAP